MSSYQIFHQGKPDAGVDTLLYTSAGKVIANIWLGNQSGEDHVSIAIVPNGNTLSDENYIAYDTPVATNYIFYLQTICFGLGDTVWIRSQNGTSSFTLTGQLLD
ncbi:hypothetical protein UFOVP29_24 [uncultured Caudovirales phage]|uniref:Uncharacterized protein n=1 Tax=uncultured Caudovirales phage TaxID=2100421 RepID=A0A6J5KMP5_9CAUD|nr:hypothetical protein UFOVP29_24 [uncultured Caudovirales phage]